MYLVYLITVKTDSYLQTQSASVADPPDLSRAVWRLEHRRAHLARNIGSAFPWRQASSISYFRGNYIRAQCDGSVCQGKQRLFSLASSASESTASVWSNQDPASQNKADASLKHRTWRKNGTRSSVCVYARLLLIRLSEREVVKKENSTTARRNSSFRLVGSCWFIVFFGTAGLYCHTKS